MSAGEIIIIVVRLAGPLLILRSALDQSIAFKDDDVKSCPNCSVEAGHHVFYGYDDFGYRMLNGHETLQSWCMACRSRGRWNTPIPSWSLISRRGRNRPFDRSLVAAVI
jgi:hypothetical protein